MTPEQKLAALFATERPPARDHGFQAAVAQRIVVRRAWMTAAALAPWTIAAAAGLWGLSPVVGPLAEGLAGVIEPSATVLSLTGGTLLAARWMSRRFLRGLSASR